MLAIQPGTLLDLTEGDIDRPLCIGVIHNGQHNPPTFSGAGSLSATKPWSAKSQEVKGAPTSWMIGGTTIKLGNPAFFKTSVRSDRNFYNL